MLKIINKIFLLVLLLLCFLTLFGYLNFGHGLGDLFYYPIIILAVIVHIFFTTRLSKFNNDNFFLILIICSFFFSISYIYAATYGRGAEFPWDGNIFY